MGAMASGEIKLCGKGKADTKMNSLKVRVALYAIPIANEKMVRAQTNKPSS